jgi:hypothetical protein
MPFGPIVQPLVTPVTSGANVALTAKIFASYVEIAEDGSGAAAGLVVTFPNGSVVNYTPAMQPIKIGDTTHIGRGPFIGVPANYNGGGGAATPYCQVKSMGADTKVRISEWP